MAEPPKFARNLLISPERNRSERNRQKEIANDRFYLLRRPARRLSRPAERASRRQRRRRPARRHPDQAAAQPRPARRPGRLARALAGPCAAAARSRRGAGVRRQSRRDQARRLGLSGRSHGADGGELCRGRRRHQSARARRRRRACASFRCRSTGRPPISPNSPALDRGGISRRGARRLRGGIAAIDLVCLGEMGIGNTTAAAAIAAALFGGGGARWAGRGTGVDDDGLCAQARRRSTARSLATPPSWTIRSASPRRSAAASSPPFSARRLRRGGSAFR